MTATLTTPNCPYCAAPMVDYSPSVFICLNDDCTNLDEPMTRVDIENVPEREGMRAVERSLS